MKQCNKCSKLVPDSDWNLHASRHRTKVSFRVANETEYEPIKVSNKSKKWKPYWFCLKILIVLALTSAVTMVIMKYWTSIVAACIALYNLL